MTELEKKSIINILNYMTSLTDTTLTTLDYNLKHIFKIKNNLKKSCLLMEEGNRQINEKPKSKLFELKKIPKKKKPLFLCKKTKREEKKIDSTSTTETDTLYHGVIRKGNIWQVMLYINGKPHVFGRYTSDAEAARVFDYYSIKLQLITNTNFSYTNEIIDYIRMNDFAIPVNYA